MREYSFWDIFLILFGFCEEYRVEGDSMLPTLQNGDRVMVKPADRLSVGDVVVAEHPFRKTPVIKRITSISTGGKLFLSGDNPADSTDSRTFGEIHPDDVLGKVVCRLK